jgi:uncharacterized protein YutE (UPF0331/DUF86 family)
VAEEVTGISLAEKGLLEPTFARHIRGMAGMRNVIVHVYWRLDYRAIYRAVTEQLSDFDEFARQVRAHLRKRGGPGRGEESQSATR